MTGFYTWTATYEGESIIICYVAITFITTTVETQKGHHFQTSPIPFQVSWSSFAQTALVNCAKSPCFPYAPRKSDEAAICFCKKFTFTCGFCGQKVPKGLKLSLVNKVQYCFINICLLIFYISLYFN